MRITVYADMLIIVNFIINYFILRATGALAGIPHSKKRFVFSALIGAFCSLIIFFDIQNRILSAGIKILVLLLCAVIAFGFSDKRLFLKQFFCFIAVNMTLAGLLMLLPFATGRVYENNLFFYFNVNPILLVACILAVFLIITLYQMLFRNTGKGEEIPLIIQIGNQSITLTAFYDTGFQLTDILNGKAVLLADFSAIEPLLTPNQLQDVNEFFNTGQTKGSTIITPVFYATINGNGVLPALKAENITYSKEQAHKKIENSIVAITKEHFSNGIQMIYGKEIHNILGEL